MKFALPLVFGLLLGGGLVSFFQVSDSSTSSNDGIKNTSQENQCSINCRSLEVLKDHDRKYNENKEFIPKAILAYLAAIGINLSSHNAEVLDKVINEPDSYKKAIAQISETEKDNDFSPKNSRMQKETVTTLPLIQSNQNESKEVNAKKNIFKLSNTQLLQISRMSNLMTSMKMIRRVNGFYEGYLKHTRGKLKNKHRKVFMDLNFYQKGKDKVSGDYEINIEDSSSSSGNGGNRSIRVDDQSRLVLIEINRDSYFLFNSLNTFKKNNFQGLYFKEGKKVGRVFLTRKTR